MSTPLEKIIKSKILRNGSMSLGAYIESCLTDPTHGYYTTKDPIGASGDFITSPEISQVFGELLGLWSIMTWYGLKSPKKVALVELGPGRGTLMADLLRTARIDPQFCLALEVHLVDINPNLIAHQKQALLPYSNMFKIFWHDSMDTLKLSCPSIFIANEFFDAMPIQQYQKTISGWEELFVGLNEDKELSLGTVGLVSNSIPIPDSLNDTAAVGDFYEYAPYVKPFMQRISELFKVHGGAFLAIDYGYSHPTLGDSLQALKSHKNVSIFDSPGESDITHHVDFATMKSHAIRYGMQVTNVITQYEFLVNMGIHNRIEQILMNIQNQAQAEDFLERVKRIMDIEGMGTLFKVLAVTSVGVKVAGF